MDDLQHTPGKKGASRRWLSRVLSVASYSTWLLLGLISPSRCLGLTHGAALLFVGSTFRMGGRRAVGGARGVPGSGWGLALVQAIAERHGGQVSLRSRSGQGTLVARQLPV